MTGKHWLAIGLFVVGVGTSISSLNDWHEATTPLFISGLLVQLGGKLVALFSDNVKKEG